VSFAQPHPPSPEPEQSEDQLPDPANMELHPDDVPDENGPDETPEYDSDGYEDNFRWGVRMCHIHNKDDPDHYEEEIQNYD
jgi:hypothetical protein